MIYRKDLEAQALKLTAQLEQITREKNELTQEHQSNLVSPFLSNPACLANYPRNELGSEDTQGRAGRLEGGNPEHLRRRPAPDVDTECHGHSR